MQKTKENLEWAAGQISNLQSLYNFPTDPRGVAGVCRAYLDIVTDQKKVTETDDRGNVKVLREAKTVEETSQELIDYILASCERFPAPAVMRRIYDQKLGYMTADGKSYIDFAE